MQEMLKDNYKKIAIINKFHYLGTTDKWDKKEIPINLTFTPSIIIVAIKSVWNSSINTYSLGRAWSELHIKTEPAQIGNRTMAYISDITKDSFIINYYNSSYSSYNTTSHVTNIIAIE